MAAADKWPYHDIARRGRDASAGPAAVGHPAMPATTASKCDGAATYADGSDRDQPPSPPEELSVSIAYETDAEVIQCIDVHWLREMLQAASACISQRTGRRVAGAAFMIVNDAGMIALHRRHANLDSTTDVLSFDYSSGAANAPIEAEVAVNADEAARQSAVRGHSAQRELLLYCIHGLLHCAGFDDQTESGYAAMHAEEDRILEQIGVGAIFGTEPRGNHDR